MSDIFLVLAQTDDGPPPLLLPAAAHPPRRQPQRVPHPAPEGQARQPLQRLLGDRAARRVGADGRRARPRRADDHRDGRPHAPGLRDRRRRRDARGGGQRHRTTPRTAAPSASADRPAADAQRARRPVPGVRGRRRRWRCAWRAPTTRRTPTPTPATDDSDAQLFKRLATAVGKFWTCKRAPNHAFESLECLGGNGYVEESGMPRLYREAPLASIWEGSGNVMSLDVLRALYALAALAGGVLRRGRAGARRRRAPGRARGEASRTQFTDPATLEHARAARGRSAWRCACRARCWCATAHRRPSPTPSAPRAWPATAGLEYGTLPAGADFEAIIARVACTRSTQRPPRDPARSGRSRPTIETCLHAGTCSSRASSASASA